MACFPTLGAMRQIDTSCLLINSPIGWMTVSTSAHFCAHNSNSFSTEPSTTQHWPHNNDLVGGLRVPYTQSSHSWYTPCYYENLIPMSPTLKMKITQGQVLQPHKLCRRPKSYVAGWSVTHDNNGTYHNNAFNWRNVGWNICAIASSRLLCFWQK